MTYYPIVIPTLNRFEHFKQCIESLVSCTHSDKTELVIGLDYPPAEKYVEGWKQIKKYLPSISGFGKITIFEHEKNLGPFNNSKFLREYCFKHYDAYIFTEDDNIFSPCFLEYMDKCLEKYKEDTSIMAVCSYINKDEVYSDQKHNTVLRIKGAFNGWGVGYWKNKYEIYKKRIINDYREIICNNRFEVLKAFSRPEQFKNFMEWLEFNPSLNRPCDITYAMTNLVLNKFVIYPTEYISKNMGFDGSGVNCGDIKNNSYSERPIITKKTYDIIDNFTKILDKKNQRCFNNSQNFRINVKERFYYKTLILLYFCFGYNFTNRIKNYIHRLFNVFF